MQHKLFFFLIFRDASQRRVHDCKIPPSETDAPVTAKGSHSSISSILCQGHKPLPLWWMLEPVVGREVHAC
jgi:hypothetical protein